MQDQSHDLIEQLEAALAQTKSEKAQLKEQNEKIQDKLLNLWKKTMAEKKKRAAAHQLEVDELIAKFAKLDINDKQLDDENREKDGAIVIYYNINIFKINKSL